MTNYYIADLHFGHQNILSFDNRPFETVEENDNAIIARWNSAVGYDDDVYVLGDISWYNSTQTIEILKGLNGNKHLIRGNHDNKILKNPKLREQFVEITDYKEITNDSGKGLVLCHYPILAFKNHYNGWVHFYGHVHSTWEYKIIKDAARMSERVSNSPCDMINVGCMMPWMDYRPKTFDEIVNLYHETLTNHIKDAFVQMYQAVEDSEGFEGD